MPPRRDPGDKAGPEPLGEILGRLFTARGWGRHQERARLDRAWAKAAGADAAGKTRVVALRRGVLEIEVAGAVLLQELAGFHKRRLLDAVRRELDGTPVRELRFRARSAP